MLEDTAGLSSPAKTLCGSSASDCRSILAFSPCSQDNVPSSYLLQGMEECCLYEIPPNVTVSSCSIAFEFLALNLSLSLLNLPFQFGSPGTSGHSCKCSLTVVSNPLPATPVKNVSRRTMAIWNRNGSIGRRGQRW
ncbi:hypothetical protein BT69DRAFT_1321569 [Atractiella rhizophila]|nr:hypothetical protein BT69DRAFT_1321569 [Atractiella rhizophila]